MICKSFFPNLCYRIGCIGLPSNKSLVHFDIPILFKAYQMCSQITIRHLEHLFQIIKADLFINHKDAHHTKTDAVVKYFI